MSSFSSPFTLSALTTGSGIAIGTDIDIAGILSGSAPTTVTLSAKGVTILVTTLDGIAFSTPVGVEGAVAGTSSGGSFAVIYRKR